MSRLLIVTDAGTPSDPGLVFLAVCLTQSLGDFLQPEIKREFISVSLSELKASKSKELNKTKRKQNDRQKKNRSRQQ